MGIIAIDNIVYSNEVTRDLWRTHDIVWFSCLSLHGKCFMVIKSGAVAITQIRWPGLACDRVLWLGPPVVRPPVVGPPCG